MTLKDLQKQAAELNIDGRSKMKKAELEAAVNEALALKRAEAAAVVHNKAFIDAMSADIVPTPPMGAARRETIYRSPEHGGNSLTAKQARRLRKNLAKHGS